MRVLRVRELLCQIARKPEPEIRLGKWIDIRLMLKMIARLWVGSASFDRDRLAITRLWVTCWLDPDIW